MHARQRLLRHEGRGTRGPRRRGALPGHIRRGLLRPPGHRGRRANGRERRHREHAELAAADVQDRRRRVVRPSPARPSRLPAGPRPTPRGAHPRRALPRSRRQGDAGDPAALRRHVATAPGRAGDHARGRELVGADRAALGPRRHGDQHRGRSLPGSAWRPSRPCRAGRSGQRRDLPAGPDTPVARSSSPRRPARGSRWTDAPSPTVRAWSTSPGSWPTGSSSTSIKGNGSPSRRWSPSTARAIPRSPSPASRRVRRSRRPPTSPSC